MHFKAALLLATGLSAIAAPALAIPVLFGGANAPGPNGAPLADAAPGQSITVTGPLLQLRLADGSSVTAPQGTIFTVSSDVPASIALSSGSLRVNSAGAPITVTRGGAAITTTNGVFSAASQGAGLAGRVNSGTAQVVAGGASRSFSAGGGYVATAGGIAGTFSPPVASAPALASRQANPSGPNSFSAADPRRASGAGQAVVVAAQNSGFPISNSGTVVDEEPDTGSGGSDGTDTGASNGGSGGGTNTGGGTGGGTGSGTDTGGGTGSGTGGGTATQGGTLASYGGTPPVRGTVALTGVEKAGQVITYAGDWVGIDNRNASVTIGANGELNGYNASANEHVERNTNQSLDRATAGGISIERWSGGVTGGRYYVSPNTERTSQQGLHLAYGAPAPAVPAQGLATYKLAASTKPTLGHGGAAPGTMTAGALGILFSPKPKVGVDFSVSMPGDATYNVKTAGGASAPSLAVEAAMIEKRNLYLQDVPTTGMGQVCSGNCNTAVYAILGGANAETVGVSYEIGSNFATDATGRRNTVTGAAIFAQDAFDASQGGVVTQPAISSGTVSEALRGTVNAGVSYTVPRQPGNWPLVGASTTTVDSQGRLQSFSNSAGVLDRNDSAVADVYGNRYVQIGRWNGGTIKRGLGNYYTADGWQGMPYVVGTAIATTRLPATGIGTYALKAATAPIMTSGDTQPGSFTGAMGVDFSTAGSGTVKIGFDGKVTVNTGATTSATYDIGTTGGAATPSTSQVSYTGSGMTGNYSVAAPSGDTVCGAATCNVSLNGLLSGPGGRYAGVGYQIGANEKWIVGSAAFERTDDPSLALKDIGQTMRIISPGTMVVPGSYGDQNVSGSTNVTLHAAGGGVNAIETSNQTFGVQTAQVVDSGMSGGMSWSRWTNGTLKAVFNGGEAVLGANQSAHVIVGEPASAVPSSGVAQYALTGHTAPTSNNNAVAPGTLTGAMAIQFGAAQAQTGVGLDLKVAIGGHTYNILTNGGTATPGTSQYKLNGSSIAGNNMAIAAGGPACPTASCAVAISGFLSGQGGAQAGITYAISDFGSSNNPLAVMGTAAFTKTP